MSSAIEAGSLIRKRDVVALALSVAALLLSLDANGSYSIHPVWFLDLHAGPEYTVIRPIVADLDGDGLNEIVCVSGDFLLQVFSVPNRAPQSNRMEVPERTAETTLLSSTNIAKGRAPIALGVGYLDAFDSTKARKQYIAVLREDWTLLLFDSQLKKLWEKTLEHVHDSFSPFVHEYKFAEVDIVLSATRLEKDDHGLVLVGASMTSTKAPDLRVEEGLDGMRGEEEHPDMDLRWKLEHFSVYALNGGSGELRWRHEGRDVSTQDYHKTVPQHMYKLDSSNTHEFEPWTSYRASLIQSLPHAWNFKEDTKMSLQQYRKRRMGGSKTKERTSHRREKSQEAAVSESERGSVAGSMKRLLSSQVPVASSLPHAHAEHSMPNVVVIKARKGIEVLSLRYGSSVTTLALPEGATYADVNGDSVIDTIKVIETQQDLDSLHGRFFTAGEAHVLHMHRMSGADRLPPCTLTVLSGLPPRAPLFNASVCSDRRALEDPLVSSNTRIPTERVSVAPPVLLRTTRDIGGPRDVVTAVSTGIVTAHSGYGDFKWLLKRAPTWDENFRAFSAVYCEDAKRVQDYGTHDLEGAHALVQGQTKLALMSNEGVMLADAILPHAPVQIPVLADFDNDGTTDIIVIAHQVLWGMSVRVSPAPQALFVMCCLFVLVIVATFLMNIQSVTVDVPVAGSVRQNDSLDVPPVLSPQHTPPTSARTGAAVSPVRLSASPTRSSAGVPRRRKMHSVPRSTDD